jgi:hypothetical protein
MVIVGAGASYGSAAGSSGDRPPLAADLTKYPAIAAKYPASRAVIAYLDRVAGEGATGLEDGLAAFGALAEASSERMKQLTSFRFYLCDVIQQVSRDWLSATHGRTYYLDLLERSLGEVKRRTKVIGRFPGETSCLTLVWAVLDLYMTHATNGVRFTQLERQRLKRMRYEGNEPTTPEEVSAA